jgi:hypothetical protein
MYICYSNDDDEGFDENKDENDDKYDNEHGNVSKHDKEDEDDDFRGGRLFDNNILTLK